MSWINVKDRLPVNMDDVLFYESDEIKFGYYDKHKWLDETYSVIQHCVTHWQPLPPPPEKT